MLFGASETVALRPGATIVFRRSSLLELQRRSIIILLYPIAMNNLNSVHTFGYKKGSQIKVWAHTEKPQTLIVNCSLSSRQWK
ncbi:hypothetical protein LM77097_90018 [Listeria monocytogenes]|nr:hypothetical protein LM77097_90018 [Listeria monocytogenes]CUM13753.1 hypothetical protein LM901004_110016 [Listeria monocytogenes]